MEGETEYGSFLVCKTLGINFDYHGICLINARGESSITKISQLIRRFHIPTVCLYDRDVMVENQKPYIFIQTIFVMKWMWYRLVYPVGVLAF